jgi:hypothetical protein
MEFGCQNVVIYCGFFVSEKTLIRITKVIGAIY